MTTEYLKEFVVLAETKNFWRASELLYMNQSTLSKHMKALEKELGVDLFVRTTRQVELTHYGKAFIPHAKSIISSEFEGIAKIKRLKNIDHGLLTLGSIPPMPQYHITQLLSLFQKEYPEITIRLTEDDSYNLPYYLNDGSCELVFLRETSTSFEKDFMKDSKVIRIPVMRDRLVVVFPSYHPLANSSSISLQQLKEERFCLLKEGTLVHDISIGACINAGIVPNILFTSHHIESMLDLVSTQNCIVLLMDRHLMMPDSGPQQINVPWKSVPVTPDITSQVSLCYREDAPLSKSAQLFAAFCRTYYSQKQL